MVGLWECRLDGRLGGKSLSVAWGVVTGSDEESAVMGRFLSYHCCSWVGKTNRKNRNIYGRYLDVRSGVLLNCTSGASSSREHTSGSETV